VQKSQPEGGQIGVENPGRAHAAGTGVDVVKSSSGLRERRWPRIDLGEFGSRGAVEPAGRVDDASPYRGGDAGATDGEPTAFVDPYGGRGVGNRGDVGSPAQGSDNVLDRKNTTASRARGRLLTGFSQVGCAWVMVALARRAPAGA
jgi:hypothetical protein